MNFLYIPSRLPPAVKNDSGRDSERKRQKEKGRKLQWIKITMVSCMGFLGWVHDSGISARDFSLPRGRTWTRLSCAKRRQRHSCRAIFMSRMTVAIISDEHESENCHGNSAAVIIFINYTLAVLFNWASLNTRLLLSPLSRDSLGSAHDRSNCRRHSPRVLKISTRISIVYDYISSKFYRNFIYLIQNLSLHVIAILIIELWSFFHFTYKWQLIIRLSLKL